MSRYELQGRAPGETVIIGWDQPLRTYFVQVHRDCLPANHNPRIWFGCGPRELYELEDLKRAVRPFADLAATLLRDRDEGR